MTQRFLQLWGCPLLVALAVILFASFAFPSQSQADHSPEHTQYLKDCIRATGGAICQARNKSDWDRLTPAKQLELSKKYSVDAKAAEEATKKLYATNPKATSCNGFWDFFWSPLTCLWRVIWAGLGAALLQLSIWTLTVVGGLFNGLLDITVAQFSTKMYGVVKEGVESAWSVFRDVSNILIIGMFTFIAISMIIGNQTYGTKKLVANVLIVAVLINFSLLFSKLIVDASNFTAVVFYNAIEKNSGVGKISSSGGVAVAETKAGQAGAAGVSGAFINYIGIAGFGDAWNAVTKMQEKQDNGFLGFLYGLFAATLILALAAVLLYGAVLLVARAVLLVFLMMVSSLAFATHLIPKYSDSEYGWSGWWNQLLRNAIFAPMLLMFLWATLTIAQKLKEVPGGGTLGSLLTNPDAPIGITTLVHYGVVLGLLYASIKIASSFSTGIAKNMAGKITSLATGAVLGGPGLLARATIGAGAARLGATSAVANLPRWAGGGALRTGLFKLSTASFDMRGIPGVGTAAGKAGFDIGKPRGEGGYIKSMDDRLAAIKKRETQMAEFIGRKRPSDTPGKSEKDVAAEAHKESQAIQSNTEEQKKVMEEITRVLPAALQKQGESSGESKPAGAPAVKEVVVSEGQQQEAQASGRGEQTRLSEQKHRISEAAVEAIKKGTEAGLKEAADLINDAGGNVTAEQLKGWQTRIKALDADTTQRQGRLASLKPTLSSNDQRQKDYIQGLGNKRYLTLWGSKGYSPGIREDVGKKVNASDMEKWIEKLGKTMKDKGTDAGKVDEMTKELKGALGKQVAATKEVGAETQRGLESVAKQVYKGNTTLNQIEKNTKNTGH